MYISRLIFLNWKFIGSNWIQKYFTNYSGNIFLLHSNGVNCLIRILHSRLSDNNLNSMWISKNKRKETSPGARYSFCSFIEDWLPLSEITDCPDCLDMKILVALQIITTFTRCKTIVSVFIVRYETMDNFQLQSRLHRSGRSGFSFCDEQWRLHNQPRCAKLLLLL